MGRPLVRRAVQAVGLALLLATIGLHAYWKSVGRPPFLALVFDRFSRQHLGGSWELLVRKPSLDSGYQAFVARKRGIVNRSIVGKYVTQAVYLKDDCVAFEFSDSDAALVYAVACGDAAPVEVERSMFQAKLTSEGLERTRPDGSISLLSQDDLIRSAMAQEH